MIWSVSLDARIHMCLLVIVLTSQPVLFLIYDMRCFGRRETVVILTYVNGIINWFFVDLIQF